MGSERIAGVPKKGYEPEDLVESAMALFHAHGFAGTSTQMLVEELGVNRNSMYAEFGSKQALFDAALRRYVGSSAPATATTSHLMPVPLVAPPPNGGHSPNDFRSCGALRSPRRLLSHRAPTRG